MNEVYGVAPGQTYDPTIELLYEVCDIDGVELAAVNATGKLGESVEVAG